MRSPVWHKHNTRKERGKKIQCSREREIVNDKALGEKKKNQAFHYQVPFVDDSKEKKMVAFVDASLMA